MKRVIDTHAPREESSIPKGVRDREPVISKRQECLVQSAETEKYSLFRLPYMIRQWSIYSRVIVRLSFLQEMVKSNIPKRAHHYQE